jgi:nicotinate-nucleotide adenylyltransferase
MTARPRLGILGGTFDPIHVGHLAAARAVHGRLGLSTVRFIPAARPPHRPDSPRADEYHRLEMIRRAICDVPEWEVSDLELRRLGPSYTWDTLAALHAEGWAPSQIFFITGVDAFAEIASWYRYPDVLDAAHFVVITRPGNPLEVVARRLPALGGRAIAAGEIADFAIPRVVLLDAETPDVSSTDIRARAARGEPIESFVPPVVAAYIREHRLYRESGPPTVSTAAQDAEPPVAAPGDGE